jgi:hypothetical protein
MDSVLEEHRFIGSAFFPVLGFFADFSFTAHQYVYYEEMSRDSMMGGRGAQPPILRVKDGFAQQNTLLFYIYILYIETEEHELK